jgi:ribosome-associated protein
MSEGLRITDELTIPLSEITLRASRSSGPGGQHSNVTSSRMQASFDVRASRSLSERERERVMARVGPQLVAIAQDERSQARNRELALRRLAVRLERALAVPRRRETKPTNASRERRLAAKRRASERKSQRRSPAED